MLHFIKIITFLILFVGIFSCSTSERIITPTDYKIRITDDIGRPLPLVKVTFFNNEADMRANENPLPELTDLITNEYGIVDLRTTDLQNSKNLNNIFFVSAEYGLKNNWDDIETIKIQNLMFNAANKNTVTIPIKESLKNTIAGRKSKRWQQTGYSVNGGIIASCDYRLTWEFVRGSPAANIYNGKNCPPDGVLRGNYFWAVDDKKGTITVNTTPSSGATVPNAKFTVLNDKEMVFSFTEFTFFIEYTFKAE
jgi:hypothetical protein